MSLVQNRKKKVQLMRFLIVLFQKTIQTLIKTDCTYEHLEHDDT